MMLNAKADDEILFYGIIKKTERNKSFENIDDDDNKMNTTLKPFTHIHIHMKKK